MALVTDCGLVFLYLLLLLFQQYLSHLMIHMALYEPIVETELRLSNGEFRILAKLRHGHR